MESGKSVPPAFTLRHACMQNATIKSLAADLAARKLSSVEATQHFLSRINALNDKYRCFISVDAERSLAQARAADQLRAAGRAQPGAVLFT